MTMTLDISPKKIQASWILLRNHVTVLVQNQMSLITQTFIKCFVKRFPGKLQGKGELKPSPLLLK